VAREQHKLAAILAADVVGYSRLTGRDECGTLAALKALRQERKVVRFQGVKRT
jgi:adenylate cyclase